MENEQNQEQELERNLDESTDEVNDVDYKAEAAKYKAIAERKAKQLEKVQAGLPEKQVHWLQPDIPPALQADILA